MIKVFSYGTLCEKEIQIREFGQEFYVEPDLDYVCGWSIISYFIRDGIYKVAIPGNDLSLLSGAIVHIPENLMNLIDEYEGKEYVRREIKTLSGVDCIMYVKRIYKK